MCVFAGASNYSGQPPFCCKPSEGVIGGGANCEVGVSFSPDHQSLLYSDLLEVVLNGQVRLKVIVMTSS